MVAKLREKLKRAIQSTRAFLAQHLIISYGVLFILAPLAMLCAVCTATACITLPITFIAGLI